MVLLLDSFELTIKPLQWPYIYRLALIIYNYNRNVNDMYFHAIYELTQTDAKLNKQP